MSASGLSDRDWDAVIVGAGMGGGAAAFALARHGRSVLLLEFGGSAQDLSAGAVDNTAGNPVVRKAAGWWPEQMVAVLDGRERRQYLSLGCGVGGSSVRYAASLDRMVRRDFQNN